MKFNLIGPLTFLHPFHGSMVLEDFRVQKETRETNQTVFDQTGTDQFKVIRSIISNQ